MSRYPDYDTPSPVSAWMMNTARSNPEGLLLLAAGVALLMRTKEGPRSKNYSGYADYSGNAYDDNGDRSRPKSKPRSSVREGVSRTAEGAADYVSDVKDRVAETASSYASSVTDYADETRQNIVDQSARLKRQAQSTLQTGMDRMLREQPLAVAILGLAAGATVAAVFPVSDVENQALGPTRDALVDAASKTGENLVGAAGAAGERLKATAAERGLNPEGLKEVAREVADTFATAVKGKPGKEPSPESGTNRPAGNIGSPSSPSVPRNSQASGPSVGVGGKDQSGGTRGGQ